MSPRTNAALLTAALMALCACKGATSVEPGDPLPPAAPLNEAGADEAGAPPTRYPAPERLVAMGDVHGDLAAFKRALRIGGLIDEAGHWAGGETVFVQTGDVLDRGDDEAAILQLIEALEVQAKAAGGAVIALNGNHEIMNAQGDLRYVTPGGLAEFAKYPYEKQDARIAQLPPEVRGRAAAFTPGQDWALRLARHNVTAIVGDTAFAHGGITEVTTAFGLEKLNRHTRAWLGGVAPFPELLNHPDGPVWSRRYSDAPDEVDCAHLRGVLRELGIKRMVVGHTVQPSGITPACDQAVWRIDVGMAAHYGGVAEVLEITDGVVRGLSAAGSRTWPAPAP